MPDDPQPEIKIVCMPAAKSKTRIPGTDASRTCSVCAQAIEIAPSGQRLAALHPEAVLVCLDCFDPGPNDVACLAPGAAEEIEGHRRRN